METIDLVIAGIEAAIGAAPKVAALITKGKEFISEMFNAGLISIEQQNALNARIDAKATEALEGDGPAELKVEPDPV